MRAPRAGVAGADGGSAAEPGPGHPRERGRPGHGIEPVRGRPQRLVLVVTELDLRGRDVALQLLDTGCTRIATTAGWWMTQASAICAGVAECASATSRRTAIRSPARSRLSGRKSGLAALTRFVGRLFRSYRPDSSPWASGL